MAHYSASDKNAYGTDSSAALIHVPASAQQAPGALQHCPVCGEPYTAECLAGPTSQQPATSGERLVMCCAQCGTYGVGSLAPDDADGEASGA